MSSARWQRDPAVEMAAPAERLAAFRIIASGFTTLYLLLRLPFFIGLADRNRSDFDPVGILAVFDTPPASGAIVAVVVVTPLLGIGATLGWRYRATGPLFAVGVMLLTTLRSSWGQLLHFENLMALFAVVLAVAPAADAWSLDERRRPNSASERARADRYGHPLVIAAVIVAVTYSIAGIAKLRYGGLGWMDGDTLRNHIASAAARLDLLGGTPAPLAELAVRGEALLPAAAVITVVVELIAPIALLDRRVRNAWVGVAWLLHVGVLATMAIGFPSPLFGVAFAPLFHLEVAVRWIIERFHGALAWRRERNGKLRTAPETGR